MKCPHCNNDLIAVERSSRVSASGLVGAVIGFVGILALFSNALLGVGIIIVGLLVGGLTRSKRTVLFCPICKKDTSLT